MSPPLIRAVRTMTLDELQAILQLIKVQEGWCIGETDAEIYHKAYPESFKLLLLNDTPIGMIALTTYENFQFIGLFFIHKDYRNQGHGSYLWNAVVTEHLNNCIGLNSVSQQISTYQKYGFDQKFAINRYNTFAASNKTKATEITEITNTNCGIDKIIVYDEKIFSTSRSPLLTQMLGQPGVHIFAMFDNSNENVIGYGIIRRCNPGYKIGPLYANNLEVAKTLMGTLLSIPAENEEKITIDLISINKFSSMLAEFFNLTRNLIEDTFTMFHQEMPETMRTQLDKNYATGFLELGC